jgi:hypothetical protein
MEKLKSQERIEIARILKKNAEEKEAPYNNSSIDIGPFQMFSELNLNATKASAKDQFISHLNASQYLGEFMDKHDEETEKNQIHSKIITIVCNVNDLEDTDEEEEPLQFSFEIEEEFETEKEETQFFVPTAINLSSRINTSDLKSLRTKKSRTKKSRSALEDISSNTVHKKGFSERKLLCSQLI